MALTKAQLAMQEVAPFRNKVINGDMRVAQRATSITLSNQSGYYVPDRFFIYCTNTSGVLAQVTGEGGFAKMLKLGRTAATTHTGVLQPMYAMESIDSIPLQGKTITLSWYAKAGANFSAASSRMTCYLASGTGTDQSAQGVSAWPGVTYPASTNTQAITTTLTRYSLTGIVPSNCTQLGFWMSYTPIGTAGADDNMYITGIQLEVGSIATPFEQRFIGTELALCQRYYFKSFPGAVSKVLSQSLVATSGTQAQSIERFPVTMRTAPTGTLEQSGTANNYALSIGAGLTVCSAVPVIAASTTVDYGSVTWTVASGLTAGSGGHVRTDATNGATAYLGFSAEL